MSIAPTPPPEVRRLAEHDLDALHALYAQLGLEGHDTPRARLSETWARILASELIVHLGAFIDGALASACHAVIVPNLTHGARPYAVIENVVTDAAHRRRGLGELTMRSLIAHCWEAGCYKIMLASGFGRSGAHAFYDALGFDRTAKQSFVLKRPAEVRP